MTEQVQHADAADFEKTMVIRQNTLKPAPVDEMAGTATAGLSKPLEGGRHRPRRTRRALRSQLW